jgi:30S ribosomal protein S31
MGKGDQRSKRGKINRGTFGKSRPHRRVKKAAPPTPVKPKPVPTSRKKAPAPAE